MMDANTGKLYDSIDNAIKDGVKDKNIVAMCGPEKAIKKIAKSVQKQFNFKKAKKKKKIQKESRKKNRRKK